MGLLKRFGRVLLAGLLYAIGGGSGQADNRPAGFDGTFVQLTEAHRAFKPADWTFLMENLRRLEVPRLIVQWTVYDQSRFFAAEADPSDPLELLLEAADQARIEVFVGLVQDSSYWDNIQRDPASVEVFLHRLRAPQVAAAEILAPRLKQHPSVRGWFITEEIDDTHWREAAPRELLFRHLRLLTDRLEALLPGGKIALSGFANGTLEPRVFAGFWSALLDAAPALDIVLFQDGVGVKKLRIPEAALYLDALAEVVRSQHKELWAVIEIFQQTSGLPGQPGPFRAEPAPMTRIAQQMQAARPYASRLIAFSLPEYMLWPQTPAARQLLEDYRRSVAAGR